MLCKAYEKSVFFYVDSKNCTLLIKYRTKPHNLKNCRIQKLQLYDFDPKKIDKQKTHICIINYLLSLF